MLTANDPSNTWWAIGVLYCIGLAVGLINGAVVAYLRTPSIIATLGALLAINGVAMIWCGGSPRGYLPENFRMFGRFVFHDVPLVKIFPLAILVFAVVAALAWWGLHGTVFGRRVFAVGDNPRAAQLAGVRVDMVRIGVFVISALAAVTAGILLGGFGGVSVDVGVGLELQAIAACVVGGGAAHGGARNGRRRDRRRAHHDGVVHAAHPARLAAAAEGYGAGAHSDYRGRFRRLAPKAGGIGAARDDARRMAAPNVRAGSLERLENPAMREEA